MLKQIVADTVMASNPAGVLFGTVTAVSPLKIKVGDKLPLDENHLQLTNAVRDHYVFLEAYDEKTPYDGDFTANGGAGEGGGNGYHVTEKNTQNTAHTHAYMDITPGGTVPSFTGTQQTQQTDHDHHYKGGVFKVKLGLKQGENVILIQMQGGQKFLVLDRVHPPTGQEGQA